MAKDYVTVDRVYGERLPVRNNAGEALEDLEKSGLVALTGFTGAKARIVALDTDNIWQWFTSLTGVYNVTDHEGRFGSKGTKVNVVAHGQGHPLSRSQRVKEALGTDYTKQNGTAQLSKGEEIELLSEEGTPIYAFDDFLECTEDPNFLKANPSLRVVRTQNVLGKTKHGVQSLDALYENSSVLCYIGGKSPLQLVTPEGEEKTVTVAQALVDRTGEKFNRDNLGVYLHDTEGGRLLVFGGIYDFSLGGDYDLYYVARFAGVSAGGAVEVSPRSGDASERRIVGLTLDQMLALGEEFVPQVAKAQFEERVRKHY